MTLNHFILSIVCLCLLGGCQKKEETLAARRAAQELRLNLHSEPPTLDPRKASDTVSLAIIKMCFEGLIALDAQGNPIPAIAERYEMGEDQKTYTFYLRDAKWSDGIPITAHDVESSWKTMLSPLFPCEFAYELYVLKNGEGAKAGHCSLNEVGVKALDDKTLLVQLERPVPYFLTLLATHIFPITPQHIVEQCPNWAEEDGPYFVGNGPFSLYKWRHHNRIEVVKNEMYWDKNQVKLQKIGLTLIEDENTELGMFENNELDWAGSPLSQLPMDALENLKKKENIVIYPMAGTYYYVFNTQKFPFNNIHIRRAFALAIKRQEIIANITQSEQIPAMSLVPPSLWNKNKQYFSDGDLKEAKREFQQGLKELGITTNRLPPLTLSYNTLSSHHKIAQAIQEQWKEAFGVQIKLENKEWKVFLDELQRHQFQVARMGGVASFRDPTNFLNLYKYLSSSNNHPRWTNQRFTELLEQADLTANGEERMALLQQAEMIFIEEMPIAPIYFYTGSYLKKPYVKGVILSDLSDADFKYAYLE
jgi:oligopeptide transport system substrate-binding protein